jgi:thiosulfate reductase cytochrome b subunit
MTHDHGQSTDAQRSPGAAMPRWLYRHRLSTRLWHWINAAVLVILLMSGLMIFNAHPRLYWGQQGANTDVAWLQIGATATGGRVAIGSAVSIPTTGVLGRWKDQHGIERTRAFPWWATIPSDYSLAGARRWHLSFAWIFALATILYLIVGTINRHLARDLLPTWEELRFRHIWQDVKDHARLRFPTGQAAAHYNILQKLSYGAVVFVLLPGIILTGMTMSPWFDADFPWLLDVFGGRQSARSIHFLCAMAIFGFILVHVLMVILAGPIREIRSMITGWFAIPPVRPIAGDGE